MKDVLFDTLLDTVKLIPFLVLTYILMEFLEHKTSEKTETAIRKAGRFGPVIGGLLGIVPQCGFSASAASLYTGRVISAGTLIAVFLSTSDEMLPVFLSEKVKLSVIIEVLAIKAVTAVILGLAVDIAVRMIKKGPREVEIHSLCEDGNCHCEEDGIIKSALRHSARITLFIFIIGFVINTVIYFVGEEAISRIFTGVPVIGCLLSALVGLIPNCAASVIITELFISGVISAGAMISGLLTGCGIGLLVLFRTNKKHPLENLFITVMMYVFGVAVGAVVEALGVAIQ